MRVKTGISIPAVGAVSISIVCETPGCECCGQVVNTFSITAGQVEALMESYGTGGEDDADYCPHCGELGVAHVHSQK